MENWLEKIAEDAFNNEIIKIASIKHTKILPKTFFARGPKAAEIMEKAMLRQKPMEFASGFISGSQKISKSEADKILINILRQKGFSGERIGGTVFKNKKGQKISLINRELLKKLPPEKQRIVIQHEKFHTKPFIGTSETLAHIYGGFAGPKKKAKKVKGLFEQYRHLWKTRPARAMIEHGIVGGAGYGGYKGVEKIKGENK